MDDGRWEFRDLLDHTPPWLSYVRLISTLLLDRIQVVSNLLIHLKHVHFCLLEDRLHLLVAQNLPFVARIL